MSKSHPKKAEATKNQISGISQVNIQYLTDEDRVLFSLNTTEKEQYRLYFTRRWMKIFWPQLTKIIDAVPGMAGVDEEAQTAAKQFQREATLSDADYETPFETEGMTFPWGEVPLLAGEVRYKDTPNELPVIGIYTTHGLGLEFNCGHKILTYLYHVLPVALERAGWDLNFAEGTFMPYAAGSKLLN